MALVSTRDMLQKAQEGGYAIPAFNIHNLETLRTVVEVAAEMGSPVILAATPGTMSFAGTEYIIAIAETAAKYNQIPIAFHLDHHEDIDAIKNGIDLGIKSVMIDASAYDLEENIKRVREVVEYAHRFDCTVEAELGQLSGIEDDLVVLNSCYTDPNQAKDFVERTGVDSLAIAIGTAHGAYKKEPKLSLDILDKVRAEVSVPLVLHGASGISNDVIKDSIKRGISKINVATELKDAFGDGLKGHLSKDPGENDPRKYFATAIDKMKQVVRSKIEICGSQDKGRI